jgi:hypothetical protein
MTTPSIKSHFPFFHFDAVSRAVTLENEVEIVLRVPHFAAVAVGFFANEQKFLAIERKRVPDARPACQGRRP